MTLAEHDAFLKAEGRYDEMVQRQKQQQEELDKREAEWRREEAPLVAELKSAGYAVGTVWDLVNTSTPYPDALPILFAALRRPYSGAIREGIARALAVPPAKFGWDVLLQQYRDEREKRVKDGLACAIAATADDTVIGDVIALVKDESHGTSRLLLLSALAQSSDPRAKATLMEFGADPIWGTEIQFILRRLARRKRRSSSAPAS